ncbi:hypothetical protein NG798_11595 [Ancylothrix sp. C2]|uniref:hypothetical protein n=1 Tax=Ancylothrix sp. D3o TaxID=2953691 RepID=UPI0021BB951E|nr:hypothetical protein [Ancylothrix sp. D3o]MCT7950435.1 hypothetical protein [Ancylothrix sp. D3o]
MVKNIIYCFRASYEKSDFDRHSVPDWLTVEADWQGYKISTVPWVAEVAVVLGLLPVEESVESWRSYLESLGFREVMPVCCERMFKDKGFS